MRTLQRFMLFVSILFTFGLIGCGSSSSSSAQQSSADKASSQSRIVILSFGEKLGSIAKGVATAGGQVVRDLEFAQGLVAMVPPQALNGLRNRFPDVEIFEDVQFQLIEPFKKPDNPGGGKGGKDDDPPPAGQSIPWGIVAIGADLAHSITKGAGQVACVIDSGINKTHPDLDDNIVGGKNYVFSKGRVDPSNWDDDNGHGSHVAGTIAGEDNTIGTLGVAPEAGLYAIKALDRRGSGYFSDIVDGIYECINAGTDVINMSLGATVSPTSSTGLIMQAAVNDAVDAGIDVVVAAGNETQDISNVIPAGLDNVIAVSAIDEEFGMASFSNFGLALGDYAAPGVGVYSTWKRGEYNTISGTSMASPHVAGVALLRQSAGKASLVSTDLGFSVSAQGSGLIDAYETVK